jgi:hypothetical protein
MVWCDLRKVTSVRYIAAKANFSACATSCVIMAQMIGLRDAIRPQLKGQVGSGHATSGVGDCLPGVTTKSVT